MFQDNVTKVLSCLCVLVGIGYAGLAAAQDVEKQPARTMQVQVLGPDDQPLIGAQIHVSLVTKEQKVSNRDFVTGAAGKATFDLAEQVEILRLWASHAGNVGLFAQWWPEHESQPRDIPAEYVFRLQRGTTIGGVVKNDAGEPIVGANVQVQLVGWHGREEQGQLERGAIPNTWLAYGEAALRTNGQGRWELDNVPAGEDVDVNLMLGHPDYVSESKWGDLQQRQGVTMRELRAGSATIVMSRGVTVSGVVSKPDGSPVADAIVVWGDDPYFEWGSQEVRIDREGKYRIPPREAGPLTVTVIAEGWAPDQRKIDLAADMKLDFSLQPGKTTRFRFVDDQGKPIPGVGVAIWQWRGNKAVYNHVHPNVLNTRIPTKANDEGIYEWTWSPGDEVSYLFAKAGYRHLSGLPNEAFVVGEGDFVITEVKR